jgi:benzoyl-CoA reductase subunit BamB
MAFSMMGGFWAPELKYAGYDKVILRGKSPDLVYLWIKDDKVEIRDAAHLKGKGATETSALIRKELNEPKAQVASIGLAGENRVYFASVEQGRSSASRGGIGAVMGDKGVKAIAVRGTGDLNVAQPAEFFELCNEVLEYIKFREGPGWGHRRRCKSMMRSGTPRISCGEIPATAEKVFGTRKLQSSGRTQ